MPPPIPSASVRTIIAIPSSRMIADEQNGDHAASLLPAVSSTRTGLLLST